MQIKRIYLVFSIILIGVLTKQKDDPITFDIITTYEGKIDPENPPKITTHIRANGKKYTIITPKLEKTSGYIKYHTSLSAEINSDGTINYTGSAKSNVKGEGNVGLHVQRFDADNYDENKKVYQNFAKYIYSYLNYILKKNESVNIDVIKDLYNSYVYFGSLARGENPENEILFKETLSKNNNEADYKAISSGSSSGNNDNSFNYAVTNMNNDKTGNNFQHNFSVTKGETPGSILHIKTKKNNTIQKSDIKSFSNTKTNEELVFAFANILSGGKTSGFGFTDQKSISTFEGDDINSIGEGQTVSLSKEYYFFQMEKKNCSFDYLDRYKNEFIVPKDFLKDSKEVGITNQYECFYLMNLYNSAK